MRVKSTNRFDIHSTCRGVFVPRFGKWMVGLPGPELHSSIWMMWQKSESMCRCRPEETAGMGYLEETAGIGYLETWSRDRSFAPVLIRRIARAEKYAWSLIPGYSCLVASKQASTSVNCGDSGNRSQPGDRIVTGSSALHSSAENYNALYRNALAYHICNTNNTL